jgi:hypothetical protein
VGGGGTPAADAAHPAGSLIDASRAASSWLARHLC